VAVLKRIDESRLEVSGAPLSFMNGQTRSNPHAIEDGQQAMSNDSQEKGPKSRSCLLWGWCFTKPELIYN
jgi:hypothetical protein